MVGKGDGSLLGFAPKRGPMDEDDLPPPKRVERDSGFSGALGNMVGMLVWIVLFLVVAGGVLWAVTHWR